MAHNGAGTDDETWEDASDVYEILSEAGGSEPDESEEHDSDEVESSVLEDVQNPRVERQGRAVGRSSVSVVERGAGRGPATDPRGASSQTPQSDYQMAMQAQPRVRRNSRRRRSPTLPERSRPFKTIKPPSKRAFIKPPRFEGKDNCLESHLVQFEIIAKHNQWNDSEKADFLKCSLAGEASHMLRDLSDKASCDDVISQLRQRYGSLEQIESYRVELKHRKRKPGETLSHLLKDIRRLFLLAYPGPQNYMTLITARDAFIDALNDRDLMIKVMEREPSNLDQAYKIAERLELYQRLPGGRESETKSKVASKVRGTISESDPLLQSIVETQKLMQKQLTVLSESLKKDRQTETKSGDVIKAPSSNLRGLCHQCHQPGHYQMQCPERPKRKENETATGATTRCVRSRDSSRHQNTDDESSSFFVRPIRSGQNRRPTKVKKQAAETSRRNEAADLTSATPPAESNPSRLKDDPPSSLQVEGSTRDNRLHSSGPVRDLIVNHEWMRYMQKYPPHEHWVPPAPPGHWVPPAQPEHWVPPAQPDKRISSTQPRVPPTQLLTETSELRPDERAKKNSNNQLNSDEEEGEAGTNVCTAGNTYYIEIKLGKKRCSRLIDTGSEVTLLPKHLADLSRMNRSSRRFEAANGTQINMVGDGRTTVAVGLLQVSMNYIVSDQINEILIGADWLREHECVMAYSDATVRVRGDQIPSFVKGDAGSRNRAIVGESLEFSTELKEVTDKTIAIDKLPVCQKQIVAWFHIIVLTIIALIDGAYTAYHRTSSWVTESASSVSTCLGGSPKRVPSDRRPKRECRILEQVGCVRDQLNRSRSAFQVVKNHVRTKLVPANQRDWDRNRPARTMTESQSVMRVEINRTVFSVEGLFDPHHVSFYVYCVDLDLSTVLLLCSDDDDLIVFVVSVTVCLVVFVDPLGGSVFVGPALFS